MSLRAAEKPAAAAKNVNIIADDQRRGNETEIRKLGPGCSHKVELPKSLARSHTEADEKIPHSRHVQALAIIGRGSLESTTR